MIEPGQIYAAADGSGTLIRVFSLGPGYPAFGWSKIEAETVLAGGRGVRRRSIEATQFHDSPTTKAGKPRRTGWILQPDSAHASATSTETDPR